MEYRLYSFSDNILLRITEDVLSTSVAHYWSPDARYIVFAKFDDAKVPKQKFKMYGDKSDVYGQIEEISYPKVGIGRVTSCKFMIFQL